MKQKILIFVSMDDHKSRSKALKTTFGISGVESAALIGERKDKVEVIGEGIDAVKLTRALRKKVAHAELLSVGEHKKPENNNNNNNVIINNSNQSSSKAPNNTVLVWPYQQYPPPYYYNDSYNDPSCIIM